MKLYRNNTAVFDTPVLAVASATSLSVTGSLGFYKDGAEWGIAYKKHSSSTWTYKSKTAQSYTAEELDSLATGNQYDVCFYVKYLGVYQRGPVASATPAE